MTADPLSNDAGDGGPGGPRPSSRRGLKIAAALVGLAALAVLAGYGYERMTSPGDYGPRDVPLVRAEDTPTKMRPDEPGGMTIPNQDKLVYEALNEDGGGEEKVERLLPPPEEPLPPPPVPEPVASEPAPGEQAAAPEPQPAKPAAVPEPEPAPAAKKPVVAAVTPKTVPAPPESKRYIVQLAAFRSRPAATAAWQRLLKANRDLLGALEPKVLRADLGAEKGVFYRLRAGPLAGAKEAKALCAKLKARKLDCLVIKP